MLKIATFRARLIFYILLVSVFLSTSLGMSFWHTRNILIEEATNQLNRTTRLLDTYLVSERLELERYAGIVSDDLRIQEYMYVVTQIGAEKQPLEELFTKQFGWLPIDHSLITDREGNIISGRDGHELSSIFQLHNQPDEILPHYITTNHGIELIASTPVHYLGELIGYIMVARSYGIDKLRELEAISNGRVFITKNDQVILSTIPSLNKQPMNESTEQLAFMNDTYLIKKVNLHNTNQQEINFYYGVSETSLLRNIEEFSWLTLLIVVFGVLGVLLLGVVFLRDFDRPLKNLLAMTAAVAQGKLPIVNKIVPRNEIDDLGNRFSDMVQSLRDKQTLITRAHKKLETLAITDTLTDLYNRRHLLEVFPKLQAQAQRDHAPLAAIIIDLDHFKRVNDAYGHLAGDQCLLDFASLLRSHSRTNDYLFRLGGEEFLILTLGESSDGVFAAAEKIRKATEQTPIHYGNDTITMTISCGVSVEFPMGDNEQSLSRLLNHADSALYEAKQSGRNKTVAYLSPDQADRRVSN